ncbi:unnamed protein product [Urochloa humidicola]
MARRRDLAGSFGSAAELRRCEELRQRGAGWGSGQLRPHHAPLCGPVLSSPRYPSPSSIEGREAVADPWRRRPSGRRMVVTAGRKGRGGGPARRRRGLSPAREDGRRCVTPASEARSEVAARVRWRSVRGFFPAAASSQLLLACSLSLSLRCAPSSNRARGCGAGAVRQIDGGLRSWWRRDGGVVACAGHGAPWARLPQVPRAQLPTASMRHRARLPRARGATVGPRGQRRVE